MGMMLSGEIHDGLLRSTADLGVLYPPLRSRAITARTLWTEHLSVIGAPGIITSQRMTASAALSLPIVIPSAPHGLRLMVEAFAAKHNATLEIHVEVNSLRVMVELLERGLGVAFLPSRVVATSLEAGRLVAASIRGEGIERPTLLAWSAENRLSQAAQIMIEVFEQHALAT